MGGLPKLWTTWYVHHSFIWDVNTHFCLDFNYVSPIHYDDVIMSLMTSQITSLTIVYSTSYSGVDQRKHQSSASLAFVRGIHRGPVNSPHKRLVTRKMFPFDDVIMYVLMNAPIAYVDIYIHRKTLPLYICIYFLKSMLVRYIHHKTCMLTSSNGIIFRVTGPLWRESTGHVESQNVISSQNTYVFIYGDFGARNRYA